MKTNPNKYIAPAHAWATLSDKVFAAVEDYISRAFHEGDDCYLMTKRQLKREAIGRIAEYYGADIIWPKLESYAGSKPVEKGSK